MNSPARGEFDAPPGDAVASKACALFSYGFRPFFLLAGLYAALVVPAWAAILHGMDLPLPPLPPLAWHVHELIYGFIMAALAGFLLTAVPSWTGQPRLVGSPLVILVLVWLAGRAAVTLPLGLPAAVVAGIDLAFPVAIALAIAPSLLRSGKPRNLVFLVLLALLFAANLRFHLAGDGSVEPLHLALNTLLLMVTVVGGRIVPAFTSSRLAQRGLDVRISKHPRLDGAAVVAAALVLIVDLVSPGGAAAGVIAAVAAALLALRLSRWQGRHTLGEPILWVLHCAYAWLPLALALKAAWLLAGLASPAAWTHALTVGAFSTMILAVMTRAALGHTGRALVAPGGVAAAYLLLTGAAVVRVFGPSLVSVSPMIWVGVATVLWTLAFGLFVVAYAPILCRARADGRPG